MIGETINGFKILEEIGRGENSIVYKAHQISLDRIVAFKVIPSRFFSGLEETTRFQQEIQAAARLKYNGIVQIYETGESGNFLFIASEYIKGYNLAKWLQRDKSLAETNIITIAESVAYALSYAWDNAHITHKNLKPENILIDEDGTTKVADLGLTRSSNSAASGKTSPSFASNPHYTAPECFDAFPEIDCRSDIYSLGMLMWYLATGKVPFEGTPPDKLANMQKQGHIDDPRVIVPSLTAGFCMLLRKMLAKDKRYRHKDWKEFLADLALVKTKKKPSKPLSIGLPTTLKNFVGGKTTAKAVSNSAKAYQHTVGRKTSITEKQQKTDTTLTPPSRTAASNGSPVKMLIVFIMIGIIISAAIIAAFIISAGKGKDPRFKKRSSGAAIQDFGSGSFSWTNK